MVTKISKEYRWEMSHRLTFHKGPCRNIHGHSYKLFIELVGEQEEYGMVLDYYDIDRFIHPILEQLDHSFICDEKDTLMINFLKDNGFKYNIIPYYTTSENLVTYFLKLAKTHFSQFANIYELSIGIHETEDAFAQRTIKLAE